MCAVCGASSACVLSVEPVQHACCMWMYGVWRVPSHGSRSGSSTSMPTYVRVGGRTVCECWMTHTLAMCVCMHSLCSSTTLLSKQNGLPFCEQLLVLCVCTYNAHVYIDILYMST